MRPRTASTTAALSLVILTGCTDTPPPPDASPEVEVTDSGTQWRGDEFVAAADYTIRNAGPAPTEYKIRFSFTVDGYTDMRWATRTVNAMKTASGTVSMPWPDHLPSPQIEVEEVLETPL
ncbi:hypothetical protein [Streptomyces griseoflavus]|uniref:hypothetical protein n=1 Tax=Streptomyces griseoflavus TaxID=35619 RepID=UPI001319BC9C|nr:hypothetical protein [Streptomyces griseoflavus]